MDSGLGGPADWARERRRLEDGRAARSEPRDVPGVGVSKSRSGGLLQTREQQPRLGTGSPTTLRHKLVPLLVP